MSELSDHHIDNIETKYRAGERVTAKILKVNNVYEELLELHSLWHFKFYVFTKKKRYDASDHL